MSVQRLTRITVAALGALALMAPAAPAKPFIQGGTSQDNAVPVAPERITDRPAPAAPRQVVVPERVTNELPPSVSRVPGPTVVVEADESSSFDWASAGIGAGIMLSLALLAAGGVLLVGRHGARLHPGH